MEKLAPLSYSCLLEEILATCYRKLSGATVEYTWELWETDRKKEMMHVMGFVAIWLNCLPASLKYWGLIQRAILATHERNALHLNEWLYQSASTVEPRLRNTLVRRTPLLGERFWPVQNIFHHHSGPPNPYHKNSGERTDPSWSHSQTWSPGCSLKGGSTVYSMIFWYNVSHKKKLSKCISLYYSRVDILRKMEVNYIRSFFRAAFLKAALIISQRFLWN